MTSDLFGFHYMDIITDKAELRNLIIKSPKYEDFIELFGEGAVGEKSIIAAPGAFTSPESVRADFTKVDISIKGTEKVLAYDIFLRDLQGNKVKPNKPVKVCIRIPKGSGTPDHVYHIVNGKRTEEKFALEEDGGYVVFETADFSEWAIVWGDPAEEVNTGDNQATGDQTKPADNAGKSANKSEVAVVKADLLQVTRTASVSTRCSPLPPLQACMCFTAKKEAEGHIRIKRIK